VGEKSLREEREERRSWRGSVRRGSLEVAGERENHGGGGELGHGRSWPKCGVEEPVCGKPSGARVICA